MALVLCLVLRKSNCLISCMYAIAVPNFFLAPFISFFPARLLSHFPRVVLSLAAVKSLVLIIGKAWKWDLDQL